MSKHNILQAQLLTYAGTLPFFGLLIGNQLGYFSSLAFIITYSSLIISFLCGIHWAIFIFFSEKIKLNLFVISNLITLTVWTCFLFSNPKTIFVIHILSFILLFFIDKKLVQLRIIPTWFYIIRKRATVIVLTSLILILAML
jgi:hypothetical protein